MTTMKVVEVDATQQHGTALIDGEDSVWITLAPRVYDLATWFWWWLAPADKKAWVTLNTSDGRKVRSRAIRVARRHVRIRGMVK